MKITFCGHRDIQKNAKLISYYFVPCLPKTKNLFHKNE